MTNEEFLKHLQPPTGRVDVILDTDAYNEIDDQYAIAYLLLSTDRLNTIGICAAPFFTDFNEKSDSAEDGMEKSYVEIQKILGLMGKGVSIPPVYRGSTQFLPNETTPVLSDAAYFIVEQAKKYSPQNPLYILAIGASAAASLSVRSRYSTAFFAVFTTKRSRYIEIRSCQNTAISLDEATTSSTAPKSVS